MSAALTMKRTAEASPRFRARVTVSFYLLTILMGGLVLLVHGRLALVIDIIATACYLAVTALFYDLSKPGNRSLPMLATFFNFVRSRTAGGLRRRRMAS
jgi:hypothetical protein